MSGKLKTDQLSKHLKDTVSVLDVAKTRLRERMHLANMNMKDELYIMM